MGFGDFIKSAAGGNIIGSAIGAVGSLVGGALNASDASAQMEMQREFAQNGVRWKVEDAKRAGIHPLAALGAQTFSYNPVMTGDNGVSEAMARMGQGVDRAAHAKAMAEERALDAELTRANIRKVNAETDFVNQQATQSKIAVAKAALPPPMPAVNENPRPPVPSSKPGVAPFWEHYKNFDWITPVPSGDLKDYVSENQLINIASQLAYAGAAWNGKVRPDLSLFTPRQRARIQVGLETPRYYPFMGWRSEPTVGHFLSKLVPFMKPAVLEALIRTMRRR